MRRALPILLALAFVPFPVAEAQTNTLNCTFDDSGGDCIDGVDLFEQGDKTLRFRVQDAMFTTAPASVVLDLTCDCNEQMELSMNKQGDAWTVDLPVSTRNLVKGEWTVTPRGTAATGASEALGPKSFAATATDSSAPKVTILGLEAATNTLLLGQGESLSMNVEDGLLRRVTYQMPWMPKPFELAFPYSLTVASFRTGLQNVTIQAEDRVGLSSEVKFRVYADAERPEVSLTLPDSFYEGINNSVKFRIKELSNYTIDMRIDEVRSVTAFEGNATRRDVSANIAPAMRGSATLEIFVRDALGNSVSFVQPISVKRVETDSVLIGAKIVSTGVIQGEPVRVNLTAAQAISVIPLDLDLAFKGQTFGTIPLPKSGPVKREYAVHLPAGIHRGQIGMVIPEAILELNPGNEMRNITLEVFLARVIKDNITVHIRADSRGLPLAAVGPEGKTYLLTVKDDGLGARYTFDYKGQELYWNPVSNTTVIQDRPEPKPPEDEGIPGPALSLLIAALAALAMSRRRRS